MAKHKVSELEGALLDAAVAEAEGLDIEWKTTVPLHPNAPPYSTDWQLGGPIIERERISLMFIGAGGWSANFEQHFDEGSQDDPHTGATPLIAAMRAYVASKFGEEVDLP